MKAIFALLLLLPAMQAAAGEAGPARQELETFTQGLNSLQLEFTQTVKGDDGSIQDETSGRAWLRKPDQMRWEYKGDYPETIVATGRNVWIYDEDLEQVTVKPQSDKVSDAPLLILTDISKLDEQFTVTEMGKYEGLDLLELKSRSTDSEFARILMGLDASGIHLMIMEDAFGQRTEMHFSHVVKNGPIDDALFTFTPPKGVDLVGQPVPEQ